MRIPSLFTQSHAKDGPVVFDEITGQMLYQPVNKYSQVRVDARSFAYANGNDDSGPAATHDASAGAVPSYTTAKRGQFCVVTVAGTLGGRTVPKGAILIANRNSPTIAAHWDIVADSTAEFNLTVEEADGGELALYGTYLLVNANPDERINLVGEYTILNLCGYAAIHHTSNDAVINAATFQAAISAETEAVANDPLTGASMQRVTRLTCSTTAHAANFKTGQIVVVHCSTVHPAVPDTYITEAARIQYVDTVNGFIFLDSRLEYHDIFAAATTVNVNSLSEARADRIAGDCLLMSAPTIIGESVGWWRTLRGDEVTATITANSGSDRTISRTAHGLLVNQDVVVGTVAGTLHTSCNVKTIVDANTFVITVPATQDHNGSSPSIPTSGTLYYAPKYTASDFDTTTHGSAISFNNAHGHNIKVRAAKLFAGAVKARFSHFGWCEIEREFGNDPYTSSNNGNGRLPYDKHDYCSWRNYTKVRGKGTGRHAYTDNERDSSGGYSSSKWLNSTGVPGRNYVEIFEESADGGGADTHLGRGTRIVSTHLWPCQLPYAASYRGFIGNIRGSNEKRKHVSEGGFRGLVLRALERPAGSIEDIDLEVSNLPYNNTSQMGFETESHASITNKPTVIGRMKFSNAGIGSSWNAGVTGRLSRYEHRDIALRGITLLGNAIFHADEFALDYTTNSSAQTTRTAVVMSNDSRFSAGLMTIVLGAANNPAQIFTDNDNTTGKIVNIGTLVVRDPSNVGMPALLTAGRDANFTLNIGTIIYNGVELTTNIRPDLRPSRILVPPVSLNSISNFTHTTANIFAVPVHVKRRTTFTGIAFGIHAASTNLNVRVGVYRDNGGVPGALVSGSTATGGPYTVAADTSQTVAISGNLTLDPGWYWLAIQTDQNQSLKGITGTGMLFLLGADDMIQGGGRVSVANTYANGMPSTFGTAVFTLNAGPTYLGLVRSS